MKITIAGANRLRKLLDTLHEQAANEVAAATREEAERLLDAMRARLAHQSLTYHLSKLRDRV